MPKKLAEYKRKRRFDITREPSGEPATKKPERARSAAPIFVVQKHHARRLHYDFRLELDGTLKSWAVPKGPSIDPNDKRLAVQVEDHPLSYATFEGDIPEGQYGAGHVAIWDKGTWSPLNDARKGLVEGKLELELAGEKLKGKFELIRMKKPNEKAKPAQWLLIKARDAHAGALPTAASDAPGASLPPMLAPALATHVDRPPAGDFTYEIKLDGYRIIARIEDGKAKLITRNGHDYTHRVPEHAKAIEALGVDDTVLDGELVVFDASGISRFQSLQNAFESAHREDIRFVVFDMPFLSGRDLRKTPLHARRDALRTLMRSNRSALLAFSESVEGDVHTIVEVAKESGIEGLIGKRRDSPYTSGRSLAWVKLKWKQRQELVIVGYSKPKGSRTGFGALLLGVYEKGRLTYAGRVGAGFDERQLKTLHAALEKRRVRSLALENAPVGFEAKDVSWTKPELVAEVEFAEWTSAGLIRQGVFLGLRTDKRADEIVHETPVRVPGSKASRGRGAVSALVAGVAITHSDRVIDAESGVTKGELASYYASVAAWMLPHLTHRPVALVRAPDGLGKSLFFQKHAQARALPGVRTMSKSLDRDHPPLLAIDTEHALVSAVQMGTIELHTWNAVETAIEKPDRMIFDLDPDPALPFSRVVEGAELLKVLLDELRLTSFVKTTGGAGLHVVVPLRPVSGWDAVKAFSRKVAEHLAHTIPDRFVATMGPKNRVGRIFVDYLRNSRGASTVAAFSARARPGLTVSVPMRWRDLRALSSPSDFDVRTVPARLARLRADPWRGYAETDQTIIADMLAMLGANESESEEGNVSTAKKSKMRTTKRASPKKATTARKGTRRYGAKAGEKVEKTMHELKRGTLRSGSQKKVTSRKQAIAIGLSEARRAGGKVPEKKDA